MKSEINKFYLDLSDSGQWLIKRGEDRFLFGTDKEKAEKLIERLNSAKNVHVRQYHTNRLFIYWDYKKDEEKAEIIEII